MKSNLRAGTGISIALWIVILAMVPLAAVFLLSLVAAGLIAAAILTVYFLLRSGKSRTLPRRSRPHTDEIELAPRDYRRIPGDPPAE